MLPEKFIPDIVKLGQRFDEPNLLAVLQQATTEKKAFVVTHDDMLLVLKPFIDDRDRLGVLAWVGIHKNTKTMAEDFALIYRMAKQTGMQFIRFETKRKGFVRLASRYGYQSIGRRDDFDIYQKEVV